MSLCGSTRRRGTRREPSIQLGLVAERLHLFDKATAMTLLEERPMKPGRFSYEAPATLEAVLKSLATWHDDAKLIAGGQSLAPMLNMRLGAARTADRHQPRQ